MKIIGINGFKRSGKGEAHRAVETLSVSNERVVKGVGFSDKLKVIAARSLGFTERTDQECIDLMDSFKLDSPLNAQFGIDYFEPGRGPLFRHELTGREYLQNMGSWGRKVFGEDFWVDQVLPEPPRGRLPRDRAAHLARDLQDRWPGVDTLCLTDTRYVNEAQRIIDLGGVIWEIVRPGLESDGHDSEQPLPREQVKRVIVNDGSLEDLHEMVADSFAEDFSC